MSILYDNISVKETQEARLPMIRAQLLIGHGRSWTTVLVVRLGNTTSAIVQNNPLVMISTDLDLNRK